MKSFKAAPAHSRKSTKKQMSKSDLERERQWKMKFETLEAALEKAKCDLAESQKAKAEALCKVDEIKKTQHIVL